MKTFYILIENYGHTPDFEEYIDAETKEVAVHDLCQKYPNLNPDLVAEAIQEVDEDFENEKKEDIVYAEKADRDQRDVYEQSRGV